MKVTYEGFTWVSRYEQRDNVCPMTGFYATPEDAEKIKSSLLKECVLKKITVVIEPFTPNTPTT